MTWALEGTKQLTGVPGKPHVNLLTGIARNLVTAGQAPPTDPTTRRLLAGGGLRQLRAPWSIASVTATVGLALFVAQAEALPRRSAIAYLTAALASGVLAAVLPSPARALTLPAFLLAAVALAGMHAVPLVPLVQLTTYVAFAGSSLHKVLR